MMDVSKLRFVHFKAAVGQAGSGETEDAIGFATSSEHLAVRLSPIDDGGVWAFTSITHLPTGLAVWKFHDEPGLEKVMNLAERLAAIPGWERTSYTEIGADKATAAAVRAALAAWRHET